MAFEDFANKAREIIRFDLVTIVTANYCEKASGPCQYCDYPGHCLVEECTEGYLAEAEVEVWEEEDD